MAANAPRKPNTKMKVAAKKAAARRTAGAPAERPAPRPVARHEAALPEVQSLTQELELEKPASAAKPSTRGVPSASAALEPVGAPSRGGIRNRDVVVFLRQLIMMFESGTPILKALKSLARRSENKNLRGLVGGIADFVEAGNPLWQAFAREGRYFSSVDVNLIKAAEASGSLPAVLKRIAQYREERDRLNRKIQVALIYPVILVTVATALVVIMSVWVIPEFRDLFAQMNAKIGGYSEFIMDSADFVRGWWYLIVGAIVAVIAGYKLWWIRNPVRQLAADRAKLRIPVLGGLAKRRVTADFMRTFAMLIRSGVSMMATLDLCKNSVSNRAYISVVQDMRDSVEAGEGLEAPLRKAEKDGYLSGVVVDMLLTGEESGGLERVADQIAESYEEDVEIGVAGLTEAITPVFVVFMGFIVGAIVIGMFLPLISMIQNISAGSL